MAGEVEPVEYYENPVVTQSGEERLIAWHNSLLTDETGNVTGVLSSGEDITQRCRTEDELRRFKAIVEASSEAIAITDPQGQFIYINPAHEQLFGRSLEEARASNYRDYYPPESVEILNRF